MVYVVWGFSYILQLRKRRGDTGVHGIPRDFGLFYAWLPAWTVAFSDIGCFAWGRALGRRCSCPWISPNKTVEGALGGIATAVLGVLLRCSTAPVPFNQGILIGVAGAVAAPIRIYGSPTSKGRRA